MAVYKSDQIVGVSPQVDSMVAFGQSSLFTFKADTAVVAADVIQLGIVPSGFVADKVQVSLSAGTPAGNIGFLNDDGTDLGATISAVANGSISACLTTAMAAGDGKNRKFGIKGQAVAAGATLSVVVDFIRVAS